MDLELLAKNLRFFRKAHGYTQEQLGEILNIQRQSYCNYENGRRIPNIEILADIARLYDITLDTLLQPVNNNSDSAAANYTLSQLITDFLSLSESDKKDVQTFISFKKSQYSDPFHDR
ncbi:MAG: helix-turn-helix transcriptional regulator [Ruminococcus sp.]|jgi:transcriptional regulator with XRE-family HTH domain